jgi:hypothetical protein
MFVFRFCEDIPYFINAYFYTEFGTPRYVPLLVELILILRTKIR